jgi:hypothetical protein
MPRREPRTRSRVARAAFIVVALGALAVALVHSQADASLEGEVFTSREANVRMVVPRGWRVSDLPTYPGVLLWMAHTKPRGLMLLTADTLDREARCAWPATCRTAGRPLAEQMACGLAARLTEDGFKPGPVQSGRTPWFDYEDGKQWLRQAVLVSGAHAVTVVLSAPSAADRASHARAFDRAVRSLRPLTALEAAAAAPAIDAGLPIDAGDDGGTSEEAPPPVPAETGDGGVPSVIVASAEDGGAAAVPDAGVPALGGPAEALPLEPCPEKP